MKGGVATDHSHRDEREWGERKQERHVKVMSCLVAAFWAEQSRQGSKEGQRGSGKCVRHAAWHTECKKAVSGMDLLGSAPAQKTRELKLLVDNFAKLLVSLSSSLSLSFSLCFKLQLSHARLAPS